jgi:molecular chaperone DnaK
MQGGPVSAERIFGIDLGTTNSEIAYFEGGRPVVVPLQDGELFLPSVVGVDRAGNVITGFAARNQYAAFPEDTIVSIKRKMGSGESVTMAGRTYTPAEVSSHILLALKAAAERETGQTVRKVVITVPAYFTDLQRRDTIHAGELAGLEVVRIINEPTAAALAYGCGQSKREKVLVYDLGGGTFDVSLVQIEQGILEVLATDGNTALGGDDFDALLADHFVQALPPDAVGPEDRRARARLQSAAERTKIALSTETTRPVAEEFITTHAGKPVHLDLTVTRRELEDLVEDPLSKTFELLDHLLAEAKVADEDIGKVLLVGGSTYMPRITEELATVRGLPVHREVDPMFAVAIGAAVQGAIMAGEPIETILVDVNSHSLGVRTVSFTADGQLDPDTFSIVIHRNTPIPTSMTNTYHTMHEDQEKVEVQTFQGESPVASENTSIGSFLLDLPRKLPAESPIEIGFSYNLNGTVEVSALERQSGARKAARFDVNRLVTAGGPPAEPPGAAEVPAAESPRAAREPMSRSQCERLLRNARKKSNRIGVDPGVAARIAEQADRLEKVLSDGSADAASLAADLAELIAGV